jgi:hypothetical protein
MERERAGHHAWLDDQTTLRRGVAPGPRADPGAYRDYPRLAALVGMGEGDYRALAPGAQRRVRLDIDRALRARADATHILASRQVGQRTATGAPYRAPISNENPRDAAVPRPRLSARERQFASIDDDPHRSRFAPRRGRAHDQ